MPKKTYQEIRTAILTVLRDGKEHSYASLERKVNTNWETVRNQCQDLAIFDAVTINNDKVKITPHGNKALSKLKSKKY